MMNSLFTCNLNNVSRETFYIFSQQFFNQRLSMEKIQEYLKMLREWNKKLSLVGHGEINNLRQAVKESSFITSLLKSNDNIIYDLGSGNGLPGIINAIECPNKKFHLVDSRFKKSIFLNEVIRLLQLNNASVHKERIENLFVESCDVIIARAFAPLERVLSLTHKIPWERMLLLKGENWESEVKAAESNWNFFYQLYSKNKISVLEIVPRETILVLTFIHRTFVLLNLTSCFNIYPTNILTESYGDRD